MRGKGIVYVKKKKKNITTLEDNITVIRESL